MYYTQLSDNERILSDGCRMRRIDNYDGYWITEDGFVWSDKSQKFLIPHEIGGYEQVTLYRQGKGQSKLVHRLVAEAYVPNAEPWYLDTVNHIDGCRINNDWRNLEWLNRADNSRDAMWRRWHNEF